MVRRFVLSLVVIAAVGAQNFAPLLLNVRNVAFAAGVLPAGLPERPTSPVIDNAALLTTSQKTDLETKLVVAKAAGGPEIAVVTLQSLDGNDIADVAQDVFDAYAIGDKERDDGALILVSVAERKSRIHTGYGLEGAVPDLAAARMLDEIVAPAFRAGDYYAGLAGAADAVIAAAAGDASYAAPARSEKFGMSAEAAFALLAFGFVMLQLLFRAAYRWLGRSKAWWQGGAVFGSFGAAAGWLASSGWLWPLAGLVGAGLFGFILDYYASKHPYAFDGKKGSPAWWLGLLNGGGSGGFGSSGGGSWGGFSGGSSGGGGSSGSW